MNIFFPHTQLHQPVLAAAVHYGILLAATSLSFIFFCISLSFLPHLSTPLQLLSKFWFGHIAAVTFCSGYSWRETWHQDNTLANSFDTPVTSGVNYIVSKWMDGLQNFSVLLIKNLSMAQNILLPWRLNQTYMFMHICIKDPIISSVLLVSFVTSQFKSWFTIWQYEGGGRVHQLMAGQTLRDKQISTLTPTDNFKLPINLMSSDCGRKLKWNCQREPTQDPAVHA